MTDDCWAASALPPWYCARVCSSWRRHPPLQSSAGLSSSPPCPLPLIRLCCPEPCSLPGAFRSPGGLQLPAAQAGPHPGLSMLQQSAVFSAPGVILVLQLWLRQAPFFNSTLSPLSRLFLPCSWALYRPALVSPGLPCLTTGSRFIGSTLLLVTWQFNLEH